jgi:N-acetylneuraminate synthase
MFEIAGRKIGEEFPPLVVAEIGINHGGSLDAAIEIAASAIRAGAEVIKHQTHLPEFEMSVEAENVIPANADVSIAEVIRKSTLSEANEKQLMDFVVSEGRIFISTPFSREAVDRLEKFEVPAYKIGSGECNNYPLVEYIAKLQKPIILSTGMNTISSIAISVEILRDYKIPFALLHCTNLYPTPEKLVRLGSLNQLKEAFPDAVLGLSDHSLTNYPCIASVALGASILERHYTDTRKRIGPDIPCSMNEEDLKVLITASKIVHEARGGNKMPADEEAPTIAFAFASVVATVDLNPGDILSPENIWVMRPAGGDYGPIDLKNLYGRKVKECVSKRNQIKSSYLVND